MGTTVIAVALAVLQCPVEGARRSEAVRKMIAARNLEAAGLPDPKCHTGVIAMKEEGKAQVCCAGYCGECSDYPTCMSVRGQNSTLHAARPKCSNVVAAALLQMF